MIVNVEWTCSKCGHVNNDTYPNEPFPRCDNCGHQIWLGNVLYDEAPVAPPPSDPLAIYAAAMYGQPEDIE